MLTEADIDLLRAVNGAGPELLEPVMLALSWLGDYWRLPLYAAFLAVVAPVIQRRGQRAGFFILLALVISAWLVRELLKRDIPVALKLGYGYVLGGALGNVFDRLFRGAVVDWLDFHWAGNHWPAFNAADTAITLGVIVLVAATFRRAPCETPSAALRQRGGS